MLIIQPRSTVQKACVFYTIVIMLIGRSYIAKQLRVWLAIIITDLENSDHRNSFGTLLKTFILKKWTKKHAETKLRAILDKARSIKSTPLTIADLALMLSHVSNTQKILMKMTAFILFERIGLAGDLHDLRLSGS